MIQTTPFLLFNGECAEAMTFYRDCLGGELTLIKVSDTPMKDQFPPEKHGRIIYARLKNEQIDISATDWMAAPQLEPRPGNTFSIYLTGETMEELRPLFDRLSEGADNNPITFMELHAAPMGVYGQFTDRYNVSWIFRGER